MNLKYILAACAFLAVEIVPAARASLRILVKASFLIASFPFFSSSAHAETDPRFGYDAAASAFASAATPTVSQLVGKWVMIGAATAADAPDTEKSGDGYWPNGKQTVAGYSGSFNNVSKFASTKDAFGNEVITATFSSVGVETGHVYNSIGPFSGKLVSSGFQFIAEPSENSGLCAIKSECRLVTSSGMLLCADTSDQTDSPGLKCDYQSLNPVKYYGFIRHP
jgi:hypothetical protein